VLSSKGQRDLRMLWMGRFFMEASAWLCCIITEFLVVWTWQVCELDLIFNFHKVCCHSHNHLYFYSFFSSASFWKYVWPAANLESNPLFCTLGCFWISRAQFLIVDLSQCRHTIS
jgi:hypothetical protein